MLLIIFIAVGYIVNAPKTTTVELYDQLGQWRLASLLGPTQTRTWNNHNWNV